MDSLPNIVLLEIFDHYLDEYQRLGCLNAWQTLVHVCRKWRNVVFRSPCRLNLRLQCGATAPVSKIDVWPLFPIVINIDALEIWGPWCRDNVVDALEHNDRVCQLSIFEIYSKDLEKILAAMQKPFPVLTRLELLQPRPHKETAPINPDSFLGGSVPHLQTLCLDCVPFPGLPKLLLSATHLVDLDLQRIPYSGYISPEAMVTCLSGLTRLESLTIVFKSPRCRPDQNSRRPPPLTRALLPVLAKLKFGGSSEYLEDLVARIDVPLLVELAMQFFHQLIFDTPLLTQFIGRISKFSKHDRAQAAVVLSDKAYVIFTLPQTSNGKPHILRFGISCGQSDWQLSSLAQFCGSSFPYALIPAVEHLYIVESCFPQPRWQDDIESNQWLELFHPFTAVKCLYMSEVFEPRVVHALQASVEAGDTEVLPALQVLFLEEPCPSGPLLAVIEKFVAARELSGNHISVFPWRGV